MVGRPRVRARQFGRLKLALIRGGLAATGVRGKIMFGAAWVMAATSGLVVGVSLAATRVASAGAVADLALGLSAVLLFLWTLGPVVGLASDSTLDPDHLVLLPLAPRELVPGLVLASAFGFGGLFTGLALAGAAIGFAPPSAGAAITVVALALLFATCIAGGRLVLTSLTGVARTRKGRDVALFIAPLAALAINLGFQMSIRAVTAGHRARLPRWARTLCEVLPSGPAALAMGAARQGRLALAVLWLVPAAGVLAAIGWLWSRALDRTLTTAEGRGERANRATVRGRDLFPRAAGFLPRNRVGAVAAKELRMAWRDPRLRAGYIGLAFPVLLPLVSTQFAFHLGPGAVFFAVLPAFFVGAQATNEFGADGPRYWANVAAGDDLRADLVGKSLARGLIAVAISVPVALAAAAVTGGWVYLPAVAGLLAVILGSTMGVGDILSVRMPVPLPESRSNLWATGDAGQALATVGPGCLSLLLNAVAIAPFAVATFFLADHPAALVLVPLELATGWSVWRFGLRRAVRRSQGRLPELLETLSRRVSG